MNMLVMSEIQDGQQVNVFKDTQRGDYAKFVMANKHKIKFIFEDVDVPDNLTSKGLLQFANSLKNNHYIPRIRGYEL